MAAEDIRNELNSLGENAGEVIKNLCDFEEISRNFFCKNSWLSWILKSIRVS